MLIFGPNGPTHLGINRVIAEAMQGGRPTLIGRGTARRNYVHVDDVAAMIAFCVDRTLTGLYLAGGEVVSFRKMLEDVCDIFLPGFKPIQKDGPMAKDQIVVPSDHLPRSRSFREGIEASRESLLPSL